MEDRGDGNQIIYDQDCMWWKMIATTIIYPWIPGQSFISAVGLVPRLPLPNRRIMTQL